MNDRLCHDASFAAATALTELANPLLMEMERKDFHHECYLIVKAALEAYEIQKTREEARLCRPSKN